MLAPAHRRLLVLLGAATIFDGYDRSIATLALPYIGRDLAVPESTLGFALSVIRGGALGAALCGTLADRYGRRRVLLATVIGYTLATAATGLSTGITDFVVYQLVATVFLTAEVVLANVVIAEEFPPEDRATGIGIVGALGAIGASLAAVLFPIAQASGWGWRGLYLLGLVPLVVVAYARRQLAETRRWQAIDATRAGRLRDLLVPGLRGRFLAVAGVIFLALLTESPGYAFSTYRAQNTFGWSATWMSALLVAAAFSGFFGWTVGGRLADRLGRRGIAAGGLTLGALAQIAFYTTSALLPSVALMIFGNATGMTVIYTYATELFPTSLRATARAWIGYSGVLGAMVGFAAIGALAPLAGGSAPVLTVVALANVLAAVVMLAFLPETRAEELEHIAGTG